MTSPSTHEDDDLSSALPAHQLAAVSAPRRPITELVGNFRDLDTLLEQLSLPLVIELGRKPR